MKAELPGKTYGRVIAWPDGEAADGSTWRYFPRAPSAQRNNSGQAQLTIMDAGGVLFLTLGTELSASEPDLVTAKAAIAAQAGLAPESVDLKLANVVIRGATLTLAAKGGERRILAKATPSTLPPHTAAFSAMLQGDDAQAATDALKNGKGELLVAYDLELAQRRAVTAGIEGDPGDLTDLDELLDTGRLRLWIDADAEASDTLKAAARDEVKREASAALSRLAREARRGGGCTEQAASDRPTMHNKAAEISAQVTRTEPAPITLNLEANVAQWL